jgi:pimeloyl-ACP methyl ester carboxylesterase
MKKVAKIFTLIMIGLVLIMGISYLYSTTGLNEMTDEIRTTLNKDFVSLKNGSVSYGWNGPVEGEIVVMVHGFSTPRVVFMQNVGALAKAGFRVLTYDHFGRGFSDRPDVKYDKLLYDDELIELLDVLGIKTAVNLIGYSMGGGISTIFAANHPERVKRLVLIAPVGFIPKQSGINKLLLIPVLGEWLMTMVGKKIMVDRFYSEVEKGVAPRMMAENFEKQFEYAGVEHALLSSMRNFPMGNLKAEYQQLGKTALPKLLIWGTEDSIVPFAGSEKILPLLPGIQFFKIKDGEHSIAYSHADVVNREIIDFFKKEPFQ